MENRLLWIWVSQRCGANTPYFAYLYKALGSVEAIYKADEETLRSVKGLTFKVIERLLDKSTSDAKKILFDCKINLTGILTYAEELFPARLRNIQNPPALLYYKGRLPDFNNRVCIGTVGTRHPTDYGRRCAYEIAGDLAAGGAIVVSGMADGIDGVCHKAALDAGGFTVAVLGGGADVIYPTKNRDIYYQILRHGTILSEYPPKSRPATFTFPQRNRIISGISLGTLIVEAQLKSGAMITADYAKKQNRDLFALPGRVGEFNSMGPNFLIQNGAKPVTKGNDILGEYEFLYPDRIKLVPERKSLYNTVSSAAEKWAVSREGIPESKPLKEEKIERPKFERSFDDLPDEQRRICNILSDISPLSLEEIADKTGLTVSDTMSNLTMLEIQGIVTAVPGGSYLLS